MALSISPSGQACGAEVTGIDLTQPLSEADISELRSTWLTHQVLSFQQSPCLSKGSAVSPAVVFEGSEFFQSVVIFDN